MGADLPVFRPVGCPWWREVGVRFADGRTARRARGVGFASDVSKDEGGGSHGANRELGAGRGDLSAGGPGRGCVRALPDGPLGIFVAFEVAGLSESSVTIDGAAVRAAAERAKIIWT
jgi:hypothetical protein